MNKKYAKVQSTRRSLIMSVLSLILCFAMLLGTTWAWFTDEVTSGVNQIVAGNLDVELYHQSKKVSETKVTETTENLFKDVELWEPGAYAYETFTVKNEGNLALKYKMALNVAAFTSYNGHNLTEVLKVAVSDTAPADRAAAAALTGYTALKDWSYTGGASDTTLKKDELKSFTVVLYWEPTDNDNDFNMNNGRPQPLSVDLGVKLVATQVENESDSFGTDYDAGRTNTLPEATKYEAKLAEAKSVKTTVNETGNTSIKAAATPTTSTVAERQDTTVTFPEGTLTVNKDAVLSVKTTNTLFAVTSAGAQVASVDLNLTVDGQPVTNFGENKVTVETYISAGLNNVSVRYNGTGAAPTDITYDPSTGKLTFKTTHFSEYDVSGSAIAYILGDKDICFAPTIEQGATEPTPDAIKAAYEAAASVAKETGAQVELTKDADMQIAAAAAEKNGASFVIPTQVVQEIEKTGNTDEKVQSNFEARIGTQYYASLKSAIAAAPEGSYNGEATTIILVKDTNGGYDIDKGRNVVLDLNGKVLTLGPAIGSQNTETNGMRVLNGNKLTIKNGTIKCSDISNDQGKKVKIGLANYDTAVLENVDFQSGVYVIATINNAGNLTLKGNTTVAEYQNTNTADNPGYPRGAILNSAYWYAPAGTNCSLNVNDSKVKVGTVEIAEDGNYGDNDSSNWTGKSIINISAGTFNAIVAEGTQGLAEYNVTGGTFASEPNDKFIADGYRKAEKAGKWIVEAIPPVAKIGSVEYTTLQAAINAAQSGNTIVLLDDTTPELSATSYWGYKYYSVAVEGKDNITIDFNGHVLHGALMIGGHVKSTIQAGAPSGQNASWEASTPSTNIILTDTSTLKNGGIAYGGTEGTSGNCVNVYDNSSLTINAGVYQSTYCGLKKTDGSLATSGQPNVIYVRGGALTINDGTFESLDTQGGYYRLIRFWEYTPATVTVNGGTFNTKGRYACVFYGGSNTNKVNTVNINGGTYTTHDSVSYLADIYGTVNEKTGSFTFNKAGYKYNSNVVVNKVN